MEKVNIKFHDNDTVTYQHNKILQFVPELSVDKKTLVTVPNIPLLTLTAHGSSLTRFVQMPMSLMIRSLNLQPFVTITAEQLIFGYDDTLTKLANTFFPVNYRPNSQMGLLLGEFGLLNRLNGMDKLPYWPDSPCNNIRASEGSFFPPRKYTKSDIVYVYDKDLCRIWPLQFRKMVSKDGIDAGYYTPRDDLFDLPEQQPENKCYCAPSLGVPIEGQVRVQLNLKVSHAPHIHTVSKFRSIIFPIVWVQEGVQDLTPTIRRLIYLATTVAETAEPIVSYGLLIIGLLILTAVFVKAYKNVVFTKETIAKGKETLRRGSSFIINGQHRLLIIRDSYTLLNNVSTDPEPDRDQDHEV
ncbi:hypothetical protein C0J52_05277 [Blattella germanica]|nr:hypothetical protein C0J52_05277 [Blattella germanica]